MRLPALVALFAAVQAAHPVRLDPAAAAAVVASLEKARAEADAAQRGATSYFATVARRDFGDQATLTVGRAADNDVRLDDPAVQPHHLRVTVEGDAFHVAAVDRDAVFTSGTTQGRETRVGPTTLGIGRFRLRLSHQRFPAIIVYDPASPRLKTYRGLTYFPIDLAYRYELPLTPNPAQDTIVVMSTRGNRRHAVRVGWFDFVVGGTPCRLEAVRLLEPGADEQSVSVYFRDATSGRDTYALGRYVDAPRLPSGKYVLDFNTAYNPACAFSEHYNCPIPSKANTLKVPIRAGERDAHYH
jgi:uncharacterized protein (DUF1684 family)